MDQLTFRCLLRKEAAVTIKYRMNNKGNLKEMTIYENNLLKTVPYETYRCFLPLLKGIFSFERGFSTEIEI